MCRIVGLFSRDMQLDAERIVERMRDTMAHGGPDGQGLWSSDDHQVTLGHRLLSIIGPVSHTSQPMMSPDRRFVITFNGEILNYRELVSFYRQIGHEIPPISDTALFLLAWSIEGVACLHRFHGFFAAAIYDTQLRRLSLITDRVGVKPLYLWQAGPGQVAFASEMRAFLAHPRFSKEPDPRGVRALLQLNYIPAPLSIFRGVRKQAPGTVHVIEADGRQWSLRWWNYAMADQATAIPPPRLRDVLVSSIERRMVADVEVGAFLSSGVDSTLLVTVLARALGRKVPVFTCAFPGQPNDEAEAARVIAHSLGLQHHVFDVTPDRVRWALEEAQEAWDEPFGDSSSIPTLILCQLTAQQVKCVLSADGGDELFFGYPKYLRALQNAERLRSMPRSSFLFLKSGAGQAILSRADRVGRFSALVDAAGVDRSADLAGYIAACSYMTNAQLNALLGPLPTEDIVDPLADAWSQYHSLEGLNRMKAVDMDTYHAFDIHVKVDRASMHFGLEAREPLLDQDMIAWSLWSDRSIKAKTNLAKTPLRAILAEFGMEQNVSNQKKGFGSPLEQWLTASNFEFLFDPISDKNIRKVGLLHPAAVAALKASFLKKPGRHSQRLWNVISLQRWALRWLT